MTRRFKILAVDDEVVNINLMTAALKEEYDVLTALNGYEAIDQLKVQKPDLILMDIMMPDLTGFDVCSIIKADPDLTDIPIIFLTALDTREGQQRGLELGGIDYLTKPVNFELLRLRVRNHLALKERSELVREQRDLLARQKDELTDLLAELELRNIRQREAEQEKLALQQQVQQAQKLESLGVLAGGIAHDFNNILTVIISSCSLAELRPQLAGELFPEIQKAAQRAADLCRQMMDYAGKSLMAVKQVKMAELVDDMIKMLKATISQNVTITANFSGDLPSIRGDASQLRQIVMNLIINASEAIGEERGEIRVLLDTTTVIEGQSDRDHLGKAIPPGRYVCLEVADNGCGMDDETRQRLFEPFYTTKFTGRGLGMSAILGIVSVHKGALQFTSQQGVGTTFKVYLPVQSNGFDSNTLPDVHLESWQGSGTILLVEDEPQLIMVAKTLMKALGFTVIEASNGQEALELYQKNTDSITMVVTDIGMPVMDGYELFRILKERAPELPIIISSGFGDTIVTSRIAAGEAAGFLSKPYSFDNLREVLKKALDGLKK